MPRTNRFPPLRPVRRWRLLAALAVGLVAAAARAAEVELLVADASPIYAEAADAVRRELRGSEVRQTKAAEWDARGAGSARIIVALGTRAVEIALASPGHAPVIAALVTRRSWERAANRDRRNATAVFIEQPAARQIHLIHALLPDRTRIGVVVTEDWKREVEDLQNEARPHRMRVVQETVAGAGDIYRAIKRLTPEADVLLAIPDPSVINADTLQNVLLATIRAQRPLIGISPQYVRAGALAAVHSPPALLGRQAGEIAARVLAGGTLPRPQYPGRFAVAVNLAVARSLDIPVEDEATLLGRLQRLERPEREP